MSRDLVSVRIFVSRDDLRALDRAADSAGIKREVAAASLVHAALLDGTQPAPPPAPSLPPHKPVAPAADFLQAGLLDMLDSPSACEALTAFLGREPPEPDKGKP